MFNDASGFDSIYIACGYTDLRRGIDGLAELVEQEFRLNPFQNALFLFCGRKTDRLKALFWEGDGFVLLYKRLENGKFKWPRTESEVKQITEDQFKWLTQGLEIYQPNAVKKSILNKYFNPKNC